MKTCRIPSKISVLPNALIELNRIKKKKYLVIFIYGKRVLKVDLNYPEQQTEASEAQDENQVEEVEEPEALADPQEESIDEPEVQQEEPVIEAKPKRKYAVKKVKEPEPIVEPEPVKTKDLAKCQHCNKEMTMKSLKYSHSKNCLGLKKTIETVSKPIPQPPSTTPPPPPAATVSPPIQTIAKTKPQPITIEAVSPKAERTKVIKEKYHNLVKHAFNI